MAPLLGVDKSLLLQSLRTPQDQRGVEEVDCIFTVLQDLPPLSGWSHWALRELSSSCSVLKLEQDQRVPSQDEAFFAVLEGSVWFANQVLPDNACFALKDIRELPSAETAVCLEDSALLVIDGRHYGFLTEGERAMQKTSILSEHQQPQQNGGGDAEESLIFEISALFDELERESMMDSFREEDEQEENGETVRLSPLPSPPARPRIPHHSLVDGDIIFDEHAGEFVSSPMAGLFQVSESFDDDTGGHEDDAADLDDEPTLLRGGTEWSLNIPVDPVRQALDKAPGQRSKEDVKALAEEMKRLSFFADQPESVRERICEALEFHEYSEPGTVIRTAGNAVHQWSIVLSGACSYENAGAQAHELAEGSVFGAGTERSQTDLSVISNSRVCQIATVPLDVYQKALAEGERNTLKTEEGGKVVCIRERRANTGAGGKEGIIVQATPMQLLKHLLETEFADDPSFEDDVLMTYRTFTNAAQFLTFLRSELQIVKFRSRCAQVLVKWCELFPDDFQDEEAQALLSQIVEDVKGLVDADSYAKSLKEDLERLQLLQVRLAKPRRVQFGISGSQLGFTISTNQAGVFVASVSPDAKASRAGLKVGDEILSANGIDFKDGGMKIDQKKALKALQQSTMLDLSVRYNPMGRDDVQLRDRKSSTTSTPSKAETTSPAVRRRSSMGSLGRKLDKGLKRLFKSGKELGSLSTVERLQIEFDCLEHDVVRVYRSDQSYKHIATQPDTTAREVVEAMCAAISVADPENYSLCEVSVVHGGLVKQTTLRDPTDNLAGNLKPASRYYLKNNTSPYESFLTPEAKTELLSEAKDDDLLITADAIEVARCLTITDYKMFTAINELEYLAFLWRDRVEDKCRNLQNFTDRFNQVCGWVVVEVCRQKVLRRRVDVIKQFVKIARYCQHCQNYNTLFAIISGLGSPAVSRLKQTWERLSAKYQEAFAEMESLMDPSRNMARYRALFHQALQNPPLVPFFPLLMKDLAFMHEGNKSKIDGLINFDKLRMISAELRRVRTIRNKPYSTRLMFGKKEKKDLTMKAAWMKLHVSTLLDKYLEEMNKAVVDSKHQMQLSHGCEPANRRAAASPRQGMLIQKAKPVINTPIRSRVISGPLESTPTRPTADSARIPALLLAEQGETSTDDAAVTASGTANRPGVANAPAPPEEVETPAKSDAESRRASFSQQESIPEFAMEAPPEADADDVEPDFTAEAPPEAPPDDPPQPPDENEVPTAGRFAAPRPTVVLVRQAEAVMELPDDVIDADTPSARRSFAGEDSEDELEELRREAERQTVAEGDNGGPPKNSDLLHDEAPTDDAIDELLHSHVQRLRSDEGNSPSHNVNAAAHEMNVASNAGSHDRTNVAAAENEPLDADGLVLPGAAQAADTFESDLDVVPTFSLPEDSGLTDYGLDDLSDLVVPPPPSVVATGKRDRNSLILTAEDGQSMLFRELHDLMVPPPSNSLPGSPATSRKDLLADRADEEDP